MKSLDFGSPWPTSGPFPIADAQGMTQAVMCLMRSLDPGRNTETIQFNTMRKVRGMYGNLWESTAHGIGSSAMERAGQDDNVGDGVPGLHPVVQPLPAGVETQDGEITKRDMAILAEVMAELMQRLELEYQAAETDEQRFCSAQVGLFFAASWIAAVAARKQ